MAKNNHVVNVAKTSKDGAELREILAANGSNSSASTDVRLALATNENAPDDLLEILAGDRKAWVAEQASHMLAFKRGDVTVAIQRSEYDDGDWRRVTIFMSTVADNPGVSISEVLGLVYATSSKMALGTNKQSTRLSLAIDDALVSLEERTVAMGGNAVIGLSIALNSSQGGTASWGSSDGVMVSGTAVKVHK
jgi:uncharacterized protein YbjQ (UPF0145 family)